MASTATAPSRGGARVHVQRFGTFLSNMVLPNIGAFIAWGLITALFIQAGWITLIGEKLFDKKPGLDPGQYDYGFVSQLGGWDGVHGGIVGPMITYLLPVLIGYTGGRMMYNDNIRGGVVGAIATMGAVAGASVPMFLGAMIMGPLGGWSMKKIDAIWDGKIKPGFEMLVNNFSAGIWGMILAIVGFFVAGQFVEKFSEGAGNVVDFLVDKNLLPLASVFVEPAKVLFLNNAINHGVFTPLGTTEAVEKGKSILFLIEANPGPGVGLLLAFALFGKGLAKASAPGAMLIQFVGGIHEIYFPFVLMKPVTLVAVICGGATGVATNMVFDSGLRAPAAPGSIIAVWLQAPASSFVGVTLSVILSATVSFLIASVILKADRSEAVDDLAHATAQMEANKGKASSVSGALLGGGTAVATKEIRNIVFACDAGMGSSAMGASVLRKKIQDAGHGEVTVVNKAISNLRDDVDLVVTHQDLTDRAKQKAPSAIHVSVDNFMASPKYDEVVELVNQSNSVGANAPKAEAPLGALVDGEPDVLSPSSIVLGGTARDRDSAIEEAGRLLVEAGSVDPSYVAAMHEREKSVSTFMGNGLAIPHGTNEAKGAIRRTGISFVRYDEPVDWNGKPAEFVLGIAGAGNDHLALLSKIAEVFTDKDRVAQLRAARSADEVLEVLEGVRA
ncbi:PTS mannitol transporter subunit IICBA [Nocardioides agariphilus]|uniref:Mannitol-specific phosphotransferase enzyme IIA component n=1 Tax=Nocardioides agariphilus TaxID=433664 RepID=A0A930YGJ2_9ACTN|nr:PTS mannitol transporter subunit IICBA [Nocardioides agariphilus]MBF4767636.1 PTS mannitol transporter subunit IICBA [Nocardioides agariphilus]